jgi:hypothetical protein
VVSSFSGRLEGHGRIAKEGGECGNESGEGGEGARDKLGCNSEGVYHFKVVSMVYDVCVCKREVRNQGV